MVNFKLLTAPFSDDQIEWRIQQSGHSHNGPWAKALAYVDARAVQNRLDEVCGPENWQTEVVKLPEGMLCKLSIRVNGEWVSKMDGSAETDIESFKGGISKALVRAASAWGIGRYLYDLPPTFVEFVSKDFPGAKYAKIDNQAVYWIIGKTTEEMLKPKELKPTFNPLEYSPKVNHTNNQQQMPKNGGVSEAGEFVVPFGKSSGKKLKDLTEEEITGLNVFYSKVPNPMGNGAVLKKKLDEYLNFRKSS